MSLLERIRLNSLPTVLDSAIIRKFVGSSSGPFLWISVMIDSPHDRGWPSKPHDCREESGQNMMSGW